jgi:hypothetical protein
MSWEQDFWNDFIGKVHEHYGTIWQSVDLLGDGLRCFRGGGYQGTCAMCRASVEALLHLAMTKHGTQRLLMPETRWVQLELWASRQGLLKGIRKKVDHVHRSGNFAAHLAQKIDLGYRVIPHRGTRGILLRLDKEIAANRLIETSEIITKVTERRWP